MSLDSSNSNEDEYGFDEEQYKQRIADIEEFERLRQELIEKVEEINSRLKQKRSLWQERAFYFDAPEED